MVALLDQMVPVETDIKELHRAAAAELMAGLQPLGLTEEIIV
jgi:hypothetical protein